MNCGTMSQALSLKRAGRPVQGNSCCRYRVPVEDEGPGLFTSREHVAHAEPLKL